MITFPEYIEVLAREHSLVKHSDSECHYSNLTSDYDVKLQRIMHYPSVGVDTNGFTISGSPGAELVNDSFNLYFLQHVRDAGSLAEKMRAFHVTRSILFDFLQRINQDKAKGLMPVNRCSLPGAEAERIEFADAAIYGWVVTLEVPVPMCVQTSNFETI